MAKSIISPIVFFFIVLFFFGCAATNIPTSSTLNDFVMLGIKANSSDSVSFKYESNIMDGIIKPFDKDKAKELTSHPGYNHTESTTLERMFGEYMDNKFTKLSPSGGVKIKVLLKDFWIEQYLTDSATKAAMVALFGGEVNSVCVAKVKIQLNINRDNEQLSKAITSTVEDTFVSGYGTGTSTSKLYRGKNSLEHTHANNINKANNKVIMMINSYFQEIGF